MGFVGVVVVVVVVVVDASSPGLFSCPSAVDDVGWAAVRNKPQWNR